jgi:hypothetical protein
MPFKGKRPTPRCGWCGQECASWSAVDDHAQTCPKGVQTREELVGIAELLEHAAKILRGKAIVFGEEPLQGALDKIRHCAGELESIIITRDHNLKGTTVG